MKAMILAAGRGERMRPLTEHTPKPLLKAAGKPLIQYHIENLVSAGFTEIVINLAHLGAQIKQVLGNGQQFGASLEYSDEGAEGLETAGGIIKALPLLGTQPFLVVNGDIASEFPFARLKQRSIALAHLVLVPNPDHHRCGDFSLAEYGAVHLTGEPRYTFSGIGVYHPQLFAELPAVKLRLAPLLRLAAAKEFISAEVFNGFWMDVGTPERLDFLHHYYSSKA